MMCELCDKPGKHWHHIDADTKQANIRDLSSKDREEEKAKCIWVCIDCHREIHNENLRNNGFAH